MKQRLFFFLYWTLVKNILALLGFEEISVRNVSISEPKVLAEVALRIKTKMDRRQLC